MSAADDVLQVSAANAAASASPPAGSSLPPEPSRRVAVVTCMDARIDPVAAFGLGVGEAHVIRNAGGVVTDDVVRSLVISQHLLGTLEVLLVHHGGCGLLGFTDDELERRVTTGGAPAPSWRGGAFVDLQADVRAGLAVLRSSPYLPHREAIRGFVLDLPTGLLSEVR